MASCDPTWSELNSPVGEFSILLPGIPREQSGSADLVLFPGVRDSLGIKQATRYIAPVNGRRANPIITLLDDYFLSHRGGYLVSFGDIPTEEIVDTGKDGLLDKLIRLRVGIMPDTVSCTREVMSSEPFERNGLRGKELVLVEECDDDLPVKIWLFRERFVIAKNRFYLLTVLGPKADEENEEAFEEAFSEDADAFFASFTLSPAK